MGTGAKGAGTIVLARHGEPALSRKICLSADEYARWWATYEETGLLPGQTAPAALMALAERAEAIFSSTRIRSIESARVIVTDGRVVEAHPDLIEAPLPPPHWPGWIKLSPRIWGVVARFWWWWFDHHDGQEPRRAAQKRADADRRAPDRPRRRRRERAGHRPRLLQHHGAAGGAETRLETGGEPGLEILVVRPAGTRVISR